MTEPNKPKPETATPALGTKLRRAGVLRFSMVELLIALVLLILSSPLVEEFEHGEAIESALATLVLVAGVLAVGGRRKTLAVAILLAAPAIAAKWANHLRPDLAPQELYFASAVLFLFFVVISLLRFILRAPRVNTEVMCAGISGYLLLGMLWAIAYRMVARNVPESFAFNGATTAGHALDQFTAFYFSFITLTTTGYGDFTPVSRMARMLAATEAMTGTFYVAILISRLVAMYSSQPPTAEKNSPGAS